MSDKRTAHQVKEIAIAKRIEEYEKQNRTVISSDKVREIEKHYENVILPQASFDKKK